MNQADIIKFVNDVLGTNYANFGELRPLDIARVDLAVQVDARLRARMSPPDVAPRIVQKFSELADGALFSLPDYASGFEPLYQRDQTTTFVSCFDCDFSQLNARSLKRDMHQRHFCPDDPVLPVKDMPGAVKFCTLEPGDTFLVIGCQSDGIMAKTIDGIVAPCTKWCYFGAFKNARTDDSVSRHICPGTLVVELPVKDEPKNSRTLFYKLEPGALFVIPGASMNTLEKLARERRQTGMFCPRNNCPVGEVWLNARRENDAVAHICPDTVVLPVPF